MIQPRPSHQRPWSCIFRKLVSVENLHTCKISLSFTHINRACAGLRHAIVIATKPHFRVASSLNNKARLGTGDNNGVK